MTDLKNSIKEGDLHKVITVEGRTFEIRYGYYAEYEREKWDPIPIFPNFIEQPLFTDDGYPFVSRTQDCCRHYIARYKCGDNWCADCIHYPDEKQEIGICKCSHNNVNNQQETT